MQKVERINRIDTPFDKIYTFNFFPTEQADSEIELINIARSKNPKKTQGNSKQLTEEQKEYLEKLITRLKKGALPK